jgi:protein-tyrosine phosphatase
MVDLHSHILPALDDGAQGLQEALEMARVAVADGISDVIATPHMADGVFDNSRARVLAAVPRLQEKLQQAGIALRVHPGAEVHLHEGLLQSLRREQVLTMANGGRYLLLELPVMGMPMCTETVLYELRLARVTPIIAHPERNVVLREQPELLAAWVRQGVLAQLTAGALLGEMGRRAQTVAERMVREGLVQMIASDAHDPQRRRPVLRAALERVAEVASEDVRARFEHNAGAVLQGKACEAVMPVERKRKRVLRWFSF